MYSITEGQDDNLKAECHARDFEKISDDRILVQAYTDPDLFQLDEVRIEINEVKIEYFYSEKLTNEKMNCFGYDN